MQRTLWHGKCLIFRALVLENEILENCFYTLEQVRAQFVAFPIVRNERTGLVGIGAGYREGGLTNF